MSIAQQAVKAIIAEALPYKREGNPIYALIFNLATRKLRDIVQKATDKAAYEIVTEKLDGQNNTLMGIIAILVHRLGDTVEFTPEDGRWHDEANVKLQMAQDGDLLKFRLVPDEEAQKCDA